MKKVFSLAALLLCFFPSFISAAPNPHITGISPARAAVGARVIVRGRYFGKSGGRLRFGSRNASISSWGDRRIMGRVPAGKGRVSVRVLSRSHKLSNAHIFTYRGSSPSATPTPIGSVTPVPVAGFRLLGTNDLGMHCVDADFSVFSILPPYNVVQAQLIGQDAGGKPQLLNDSQAIISYEAVTDANGSRNSKSAGKTNFWQYAPQLFGVSLEEGQGLKGLRMPGDANTPGQIRFSWKEGDGVFAAEGIPILPIDDGGHVNYYPLLRLKAVDPQGTKLYSVLDTVLPVSDETTCRTCHTTGQRAAASSSITWASNADKEIESRLNVLILHDSKNGTNLMNSKPVLCAGCHYSAALDLAGTGPGPAQAAHHTSSRALHSFHAGKLIDPNGVPFDDAPAMNGIASPPSRQGCYQCHPGNSTKCFRGAMASSLNCQNCHGTMSAVGGEVPLLTGGSIDGQNDGGARRPWKDLPRCQSCHTGDALSKNTPAAGQSAQDQIRFLLAYAPGDASASPILAVNHRFAEEPHKLFRRSKGHGGVLCEACHGSTHAIWPNPDPNANDNAASQELQNHSGGIGECTACHKAGTLTAALGGPHGMHAVNDGRFMRGHPGLYRSNPSACQACHGTDFRGTVLSKAFADRNLQAEERTVSVTKGTPIGCYTCHNGPGGD